MSLSSPRRCGLVFFVAATAMALIAYTASAAPAATPGSHTASHEIVAVGSQPDSAYSFICLQNDNNYCAAFDINTVTEITLQAVSVGLNILLVWKTIRNSKTKSDEEQSEGDEKDGGNTPGYGECLGAKGIEDDVTYMPCNSAHGVWWQYHAYDGGYRLYNTYTHGYLIAANLDYGTALFTAPLHDWSTWNFYTSKS